MIEKYDELFESGDGIPERYKTCGRCVHDGDSPDIVESTCYMCKRNPDDHRIDWFEKKRETAKTIKLEGRILLFDTVNKIKDIFPKECKIDIPEKVPLLYEFHHDEVIGVAEVIRDDKGLFCKAETFQDNFIGDHLKDILEDEKIGVGGFYNKIKKHNEGSLIIVDEATLREVSITLAPVHEEYYFEIVEDNKNE